MTEQPPGFGSLGGGPDGPSPLSGPPRKTPPMALRVLAMVGLGGLYWVGFLVFTNLLSQSPGTLILGAVIALPILVFLTRSWVDQNRTPTPGEPARSELRDVAGKVALWVLAVLGVLMAMAVILVVAVFIVCAVGGGPRF